MFLSNALQRKFCEGRERERERAREAERARQRDRERQSARERDLLSPHLFRSTVGRASLSVIASVLLKIDREQQHVM